MGKSIAAVYLARSETGSAKDFSRFAASYRKYKAGVAHDLVIIHKGGARKPGSRAAIAQLFDGIDYTTIDRDDEGFDIQAYLAASRQIDNEYICFLNTYAEIQADNWLAKLVQPLLDSRSIGMTGATGSYESLHTSFGLYSKVIWLCSSGRISYDERVAIEFSRQLTQHAPGWLASRPPGPGAVSTTTLLDVPAFAEDFTLHWNHVTKPGIGLHGLNLFKPFPNPHLRSNAFAMRRDVLNRLGFDLKNTKVECVRFESGLDGLPTKLAQQGLALALVGADGQAFAVDRWVDSNGFRLGGQSNVLVTDNQVTVYDTAPQEHRDHLSRLSWGAYSGLNMQLFGKLGFEHARGNLQLAHAVRHRGRMATPLVISIVIPTHNRRALVLDALHTVVLQSYPHWECVVFDNCSDEALEPYVSALGEERIKCVRSDTFLPVTDSWNRAVDFATGDYITLIGDDDGLTPNFMSSIDFIARMHETPDFIYTSFFQFFHPGVAPWETAGYVADVRYGQFFQDQTDIFKIDPGAAAQAVEGSLAFRRNFAYNMQSFCFSRSFLDSMRHESKVFHSPFPDYYLANVAMGFGKVITGAPKPLTIAGVSKKSFGFTLFNGMEAQGAALLATDLMQDPMYARYKDQILPGPAYNTNFLITMHHVKEKLGDFTSSAVDVGRYRRLQILANMFPNAQREAVPLSPQFLDLLDPFERAWIVELSELATLSLRGDLEAGAALRQTHEAAAMHGRPAKQRQLDIGSYAHLPELFAAIQGGEIKPADIFH